LTCQCDKCALVLFTKEKRRNLSWEEVYLHPRRSWEFIRSSFFLPLHLLQKQKLAFFFSCVGRIDHLSGFQSRRIPFASKKRRFNFLEQIETFCSTPFANCSASFCQVYLFFVMSSSCHPCATALILLFFFFTYVASYRVHACHLFSAGLHASLCVVILISV
jgi:hypothetical protein